MKTFSLFFVAITLIFFISLCPSYSQTIIPSGYVSGTWTVANSPFQINGDITVHTDSTLTIEPGVEVIFQGHYKFIINGLFNAVGAESDSIHFYAADTSVGWWGLRFMNSSIDTNYLAYCIFENGKATAGSSLYDRRGGGVYCQNSYISVKYCTFRNNYAEYQGGGLCINGILLTELTNNIFQDNTCEFGFGGGAYIESDHLILRHNLFIRNNSLQSGGGLFVYHQQYGSVNYIQFCEFEENTSDRGGGIYWFDMGNTALYLEDCIFRNNNATYEGAGSWLRPTFMFINRCNFIGNRVIDMEGKGGGIYFSYDYNYPSLKNCVFANNRAFLGGGIYYNDTHDFYMENNTFFGNYSDQGSCVFVDSTSGISNSRISNSIFAFNPVAGNQGAIYVEGVLSAIEYSDFLGNGSNIYGNGPAGFGLIDTVNSNSDSCDIYSNIFLDPLFADTANGDFHLTENSPCIDAGDPTSPLDPDGTITDMGAFSFDQSALVFEKEFFTGWNLVGLPLEVENPNYQILFPTSIPGTLFGYNIGYYSTDTLEIGTGYWLKFPGPGITPIAGTPILPPQSVELIAGWNMISGLSCNIAISDIGDPGSIIIPGTLYGYGPGYYSADSIKQGNGYWVKTSSAGYIDLSCTTELNKSKSNLAGNISDLSSFSRIEISDNSGSEQTLYFDRILEDEINLESFSLPPLPPEGSFDARLSGGYRVAETDEVIVQIQSSSYPLSIKVEDLAHKGAGEYQITELIGIEEVGEHSIFDGEKILISDPKIKFLKISKQQMIPIRFELSQNYPNPFNPSTTIKFAIPKESNLDLSIYNILGELVTTLVNEQKKAGYYEYEFNAIQYSSGVYLYRIKAGDFVETKKMILMK